MHATYLTVFAVLLLSGIAIWWHRRCVKRRRMQTRMFNEAIFDELSRPGTDREAVDRVNNYTLQRMRVEPRFRKILPPLQITNDELDDELDDGDRLP